MIGWRKDTVDPQQPEFDGHSIKIEMKLIGKNFDKCNTELIISREEDMIIIRTKNYLCHCQTLREEVYDLIKHDWKQANEQYFSEK